MRGRLYGYLIAVYGKSWLLI